jgi:hypothetical protein
VKDSLTAQGQLLSTAAVKSSNSPIDTAFTQRLMTSSSVPGFDMRAGNYDQHCISRMADLSVTAAFKPAARTAECRQRRLNGPPGYYAAQIESRMRTSGIPDRGSAGLDETCRIHCQISVFATARDVADLIDTV